MKRSLLLEGRHDTRRETALVVAGTGLIATTYGLVRLAYGLFLPDVQASLSMSDAVAGYVSSGASVAYCLGALAGLSAATHPRRLIVGALVTAAVGAAGMAAAPGLALFAVAAILGSTGAGLASPGLVAVVERNVTSVRRDRAQAVVNAGTGPGLVAAGLLALLLLPSWRLGFVVSAVLTVAAGVAVLLLDRPDGDQPADEHVSHTQERWAGKLVLPAIAAVLLGAASAVVWTYGRTQLVAQGASDTSSTLAWVALGIGGTLTVLTARALSNLHPARAWLLTVTTVAAATAALGIGADNPAVAALACALFGWGFVAASSALIAWAGRLVPDRAAAGTSLLFITLILGQGAGSAAAGSVAGAHGLTTAFLLSAAVAVLAALCGLRAAGQRTGAP